MVVARLFIVVLVAALLAACGGSDTSDESGAPTVTASTSAETARAETSTAAEEELLYGCIEPGTAKPLSIESAGATLDAAVFGEGSVGIVLAHESDGSLCNWASIAPEFANEGYRVLIFDFGQPATVADDMHAATKKIRELGARKIILGGASLGGTVALMMAARERNVVGAFSLSAPAVYGNTEGLPAVRRFRAPVLFVAAEDDGNFADDARALYRAAASRDKQLLIVAGSEHGTALYGGPAAERVRGAVDGFLQKAAS
jgi:pimeloyl-ACP methyl ester carboxylesterase